MQTLDYVAVIGFFVVMLGIGFYSLKSVKNSEDFFVGGGKIPWWLSGISHHVSGYSGVVFVAYAGVAYQYGLSLYFWWGVNIALAVIIGSKLFIPRWPKLRRALGIQSPTEYLKLRYNKASQLIIAIAGVIVKLFDVGAKWAAMGLLLNGFTGLPVWTGIIISSVVSLIYIAVGGLIADLWTDFAQFVVQIVAGLVLFVSTIIHLGGIDSIFNIWKQLPAENSRMFVEGTGSYSFVWSILFFFVILLSYSGGTWNLATRFISVKDDVAAKKAGRLSAILYLIWPLILFFPMWAGPVIMPGLEDPAAQLYPGLTKMFLPQGLVGLVLASMFANTLSMCTSDANTISAVLTRDILPEISDKFKNLTGKRSLYYARITTIAFTALTIIFALYRDVFGDVIGLVLKWFAALLGPTAIPLLLGLMPQFKKADGKAAVSSIIGGLSVFAFTNLGIITIHPTINLIAPLAVSFIIYCLFAFVINKDKEVKPEVEELMKSLSE
ncbi:sodium:solute symporter family protein [Vallitalea guaymasensis]|uniref:sodium:solute symporter family protein n=1 Tax=Vallitalea guaymasensis TaxID=1185412 RepID=UPI00272C298F|nr:sodium:solute symporter family protein [Vallitalea guaymasensis]